MKAVRGNKECTIDKTQQKVYQDGGYDILNDTGEVIAYGRGKTVPFGDYEAMKAENEALKAENARLKAAAPVEGKRSKGSGE